MNMRTLLILATLCVGTTAVSFAQEAEETAGKEAFLSNKCERCHAVESAGIESTARSRRARGPDLSKTGESRDAEWLAKYIEKEAQANDRDHPVSWKGDAKELEAIASWLASLK